MYDMIEENLVELLSTASDWEQIQTILCQLEVEELIDLLDNLNSAIELIGVNQYARLKRDNE